MATIATVAVAIIADLTFALWLLERRRSQGLQLLVNELKATVAERERWLAAEVRHRKSLQRKNIELQRKNRIHHERVEFFREAFRAVKIRQHVNNDYTPKKQYRTMVDAKARARELEAKDGEPMDAYQCELCRCWHVGHREIA